MIESRKYILTSDWRKRRLHRLFGFRSFLRTGRSLSGWLGGQDELLPKFNAFNIDNNIYNDIDDNIDINIDNDIYIEIVFNIDNVNIIIALDIGISCANSIKELSSKTEKKSKLK
jgi:hypothetical protein